jgi:hypothetical protein
MKFLFRNKQTATITASNGHSLNDAARNVDMPVPISDPWTLWECWEHDECIWHFTETGECISGKRKVSARALAAWTPCPDCDEFWCNIHHQHAFECACPAIEDWGETDPYSPGSASKTQGKDNS